MGRNRKAAQRRVRRAGPAFVWPYVVSCLVFHLNPDTESALMRAVFGLKELIEGFFKLAADADRLDCKFIPSGPLRREDWPEVPEGVWERGGEAIQRWLEEQGHLFLDCGELGGSFTQHGQETVNELSSLDMLLRFLGWSSDGPFGFLAPLVQLVSDNDLRATGMASRGETDESRSARSVAVTIRSLAQAITWSYSGASAAVLDWLGMAYTAVFCELRKAEGPCSPEAVRGMISGDRLMDLVAEHWDQDSASWFGELSEMALSRLEYEWKLALQQIQKPEICQRRSIPVNEGIRRGGKIDLVIIEADAAENDEGEEISRLIAKAERMGNLRSGRPAQRVVKNDQLIGRGPVTEIEPEKSSGKIKITWLNSDGEKETESFEPKETLGLERPFMDQPPRPPAELVLVFHRKAGKFTIAETGKLLAKLGVMSCVAKAIRQADLEERYVVVRSFRKRGFLAVTLRDDDERAALGEALLLLPNFRSVRGDPRRKKLVLELKGRSGEALDRAVAAVQRNVGEGRKVIFLGFEAQELLAAPGLNQLEVLELVRGRLAPLLIPIIYLTEWMGVIGNRLITNPHALETRLSLNSLIGLVFDGIRLGERPALKLLRQQAEERRRAREARSDPSLREEKALVASSLPSERRPGGAAPQPKPVEGSDSRRSPSGRPDRPKEGRPTQSRHRNRQPFSGSRPNRSGSYGRSRTGGRKSARQSSADGEVTTSLGPQIDAAGLLERLQAELSQENGEE